MNHSELGLTNAQKAEILPAVKEISESEDAIHLMLLIEYLSDEFNVNPIAGIEEILRDLESRLHLIAVEVNARERGSTSTLPHTESRSYPYFVDVMIGEDSEIVAEGIDPELNKQNLRQAGILNSRALPVSDDLMRKLAHALEN